MLITIGNVCNYVALGTLYQLKSKDGMLKLLEANEINRFTHYIVCDQNRLRIKSNSIYNGDGYIDFIVCEQIDEYNWKEHWHRLPYENNFKMEMSVDGPRVILVNHLGQSISFENVFTFIQNMAFQIGMVDNLDDLLRLHVKYIGQTELDPHYIRFKNHEKISLVSDEILEKKPWKEVFVKLLSFQKPLCMAYECPDVESVWRCDWIPGGGLLENMPNDDWKTIVEGCMIKYFEPEYNVQFKHNFPSDRHTSYKYFYDNRVRSVYVELREENMAYVTGNDNTPYTRCKLIHYSLDKDKDGVLLFSNDQNGIELDNMIRMFT